MPSVNYQARFAKLVEEGKKKHTIRDWKNPVKVGDTLYQFTAMQTKACRRLRTDICTRADDIWIHKNGAVMINGKVQTREQIEELAKADGFSSVAEFMEFFVSTEKQTYKGQLIWWA